MDIVFLDANVLFSAAYRLEAKFLKLWQLPDLQLVSSRYAVGEAQRNLKHADQRVRLEALLRSLRLVPEAPNRGLPAGVDLPAKDVPILLAAICANATHLLSTDLKHFGPHYWKVFEGVLILRPADYFLMRPL